MTATVPDAGDAEAGVSGLLRIPVPPTGIAFVRGIGFEQLDK
jgi:hypothetical protein